MDELVRYYTAERLARDEARARRFWAGQAGAERVLLSVQSNAHNYRQVFDDEVMMRNAMQQLAVQATLPGVNLPAVFADYGTVSTAKYWGGQTHGGKDGVNIYIDPVAQTIEEALALVPREVEDTAMDAAHGVGVFARTKELLGTDRLWYRTVDMQGTLNTAGLVMNQEELMMAMYGEPEKVHAFLDKVCDFLIRLAKYQRDRTGNRVCGNIWPYVWYPSDLGIGLTEDLMPLMSAELYRDFGIPYLKRIAEALGPVLIHCCGNYGHQVKNLVESGIPIAAVEFHHPATKVEELLPLAERGTVLIPYVMLHQEKGFETVTAFYRHLPKNTPEWVRYWFACWGEDPEYLEFAREQGF